MIVTKIFQPWKQKSHIVFCHWMETQCMWSRMSLARAKIKSFKDSIIEHKEMHVIYEKIDIITKAGNQVPD